MNRDSKEFMNLISHLMFGATIVFLLEKLHILSIEFTMPFILFGALFSILPDIDGLFAKKLSSHHSSPFHKPIFWIFGLGALTLVTSNAFLGYFVVAIACVLGHIMTDFVFARTTGIQFFAPFNKKAYSLFNVNSEMGNFRPTRILKYFNKKHIKNYMENKVLFGFEVAINLTGLILLIGF